MKENDISVAMRPRRSGLGNFQPNIFRDFDKSRRDDKSKSRKHATGVIINVKWGTDGKYKQGK
jgi:hypothetical protein